MTIDSYDYDTTLRTTYTLRITLRYTYTQRYYVTYHGNATVYRHVNHGNVTTILLRQHHVQRTTQTYNVGGRVLNIKNYVGLFL